MWSYDFMVTRIADERAFRILTLLNEYTRECLTILVQRRITSQDIIEQLFHLFVFRGTPEYICSDNGPEFAAKGIRSWLNDLAVKTLFIRNYRGIPASSTGGRKTVNSPKANFKGFPNNSSLLKSGYEFSQKNKTCCI